MMSLFSIKRHSRDRCSSLQRTSRFCTRLKDLSFTSISLLLDIKLTLHTKCEHYILTGIKLENKDQLLNEMEGWEEDMDKLLIMLPIIGTMSARILTVETAGQIPREADMPIVAR